MTYERSPRVRRRGGTGGSRRRPHRTRPVPRVVAVLAVLSLGALGAQTTASAAAPGTATAGNSVQFPVIPSQLTQGAACTKTSQAVDPSVPWAQQFLGLPRVWQFTRGSGVTVGVIDSGVAPGASALSGRVTADGAAARDCVGHGTFVAGLIAAKLSPGTGFSGVAPDAQILAEAGTDASGTASVSLVAHGIRAAVDGGATVLDVSAALSQDSPELEAAVSYAEQHDVLVVAPAVQDQPPVNTDTSAAPVSYWPAAYGAVLSVVDIDLHGARPTSESRPARADLAAPGQAVTGIGPVGDGHFLGNGSSLAAAFVAGTAALVRAYAPQLTATQVAQRLKSTAYPAQVPVIDPVSAVTSILPSSPSQAGARTQSTIRISPPMSDGGAVRRAFTLVGGSVLLLMVVGAGAALAIRVRRPEAVVAGHGGAFERGLDESA